MTPETYLDLKEAIISRGYEPDIEWAENLRPCDNAQEFCIEYIWVICNSGIKNKVAEIIFEKIKKAIANQVDISEVFGHKGKVSAIKKMILDHKEVFQQYLESENKLEFCGALPWIGDITKYHLVKNLGENYIKPDRHLVRIAKSFNTDPFKLCQDLSDITGDRLHTVDVVLWRAGTLGLV